MPQFLMCLLRSEAPAYKVVADSLTVKCKKCESEVWLHPSSKDKVLSGEWDPICGPCIIELEAISPTETEMIITENTINDLEDHFGIRFKEEDLRRLAEKEMNRLRMKANN